MGVLEKKKLKNSSSFFVSFFVFFFISFSLFSLFVSVSWVFFPFFPPILCFIFFCPVSFPWLFHVLSALPWLFFQPLSSALFFPPPFDLSFSGFYSQRTMSFLPTIDRRCNGGGGHPLKKMIRASHRRRRFDVSDYFRFGP